MRRCWYIVCVSLLCLVLVSCATTHPVTLTGAHSDIEVRLQYDSVSRDHYRYIYLSGDKVHDTLHIIDSIYIDRWRLRTDTIQHTDTIYQPVEVEKPVNTFLVKSGIALWFIIAFAVLMAFAIFALKFFRL